MRLRNWPVISASHRLCAMNCNFKRADRFSPCHCRQEQTEMCLLIVNGRVRVWLRSVAGGLLLSDCVFVGQTYTYKSALWLSCWNLEEWRRTLYGRKVFSVGWCYSVGKGVSLCVSVTLLYWSINKDLICDTAGDYSAVTLLLIILIGF